jgi:hypothetical protein
MTSGYGANQYTFNNQSEIDQLMRKMSIDVSYIIRSINPSKVIFTFDSDSWRKSINIEENQGYKANRTKSEFINWNNVFKALNEFKDIMNDNVFITTKIDKAEADDILTMWAEEFFHNQNQHVVIVSGDEDVRQLVQSKEHNNEYVFLTVFNPFISGKKGSKKLFIPPHFNQWLNKEDKGDIFDMNIDLDKDSFNKLRNEKVFFEEINGKEIALWKIFCGDDGDNVPSIFTWIKNNKEVRITDSKFKKILELSDISLYNKYTELLDKKDSIMNSIKKVTKETPSFKIKDRLERQFKLVILDSKLFPREIKDKFEELKTEELNKKRINVNNIKMRDLLEGTQYVKSKSQENESKIFKEIDRISKNALF